MKKLVKCDEEEEEKEKLFGLMEAKEELKRERERERKRGGKKNKVRSTCK